jgi:hypothetical protein
MSRPIGGGYIGPTPMESFPPQAVHGNLSNQSMLGQVTIQGEQRTNKANVPCIPMPNWIGVRAYPLPSPGSPNPYPTIPSALDFNRVDPDMAGRGGLYETVTGGR